MAVRLLPQDTRGSQQVKAIEESIRATLAFLKTKDGKALVQSKKESAKITGSEVVLVGPDAHFHWADPACISLFLLAAACSLAGRVVLLGDLIEAGAFSSHKRKTVTEESGGYIDAEIYTARMFLDAIREILPDAEIILLGGNHEARVEAYAAVLPGSVGQAVLAGCDPYALLSRCVNGTRRENFTIIPYQKALSHYAITADLWAIHGWCCGVNFCADTLRRSLPVSIVCGHAHRQQSVSVRNPIDNSVRKVWSPGTLSLLQPLWNAPNPTDWVQGFSVIYVGLHGSWTDYTVTIRENGCVMPGGTQLKAVGCAAPKKPGDSPIFKEKRVEQRSAAITSKTKDSAASATAPRKGSVVRR